MVKRCVILKAAMLVYSTDDPSVCHVISTSEWQLIEKVVELLRPFEEVTRKASSRDASIAMVIHTTLLFIIIVDSVFQIVIRVAGYHVFEPSISSDLSIHLPQYS